MAEADSVTIDPAPRRPRDLALLLLAGSGEPPRARARDQQADRIGLTLWQRVLDRVAAVDPDPEGLEEALARLVLEFGDPTGPTRGVASLFRQQWEGYRSAPASWPWLLAEAVERSGSPPASRREARRGLE